MTELDPAAELAAAQRRQRQRMLVVAAAIAVAVVAAGALLVWCHRPAPEIPPIARPYLWKVEAPGGGAPSYLFGTLHVGYAVDDLPASVRGALDGAAIAVFESDLLARDDAAPEAPHAGRARLTDAEWATLARLSKIPEAELATWSTSHVLGAALSSALRPVEPMDRALQQRATDANKQLVFLETRQLEQVMDDAPLLDGIRAIIAHPKALRAQMLQIVRAYATGADGGCAHTGATTEDLTRDLNAAWEDAIAAQLAKGGAFVAIGCAHLDGEGSIVARMRARGYELTRQP